MGKKRISLWRGTSRYTSKQVYSRLSHLRFWLFIMLCLQNAAACVITCLWRLFWIKKEIMWLSAQTLAMNHETKKAPLNRWDSPDTHLLSYSFVEWIYTVQRRPGVTVEKQTCRTRTTRFELCLGTAVLWSAHLSHYNNSTLKMAP